MKQGLHSITISPSDIQIQIVPEFISKSATNLENPTNITVSIPDESIGYIIPMKFIIIDEIKPEIEISGLFDINTIYFNENIRRDVLDELYRDNVKFDMFIRQVPKEDSVGPKIIKEYKNCYFYRQELAVPEIGMAVSFRYHFTNSAEPWEISDDRIKSLIPPNQYVYDYAVSKAIKNLQYPINDLCRTIKTMGESMNETIILTSSEYVKMVNAGRI